MSIGPGFGDPRQRIEQLERELAEAVKAAKYDEIATLYFDKYERLRKAIEDIRTYCNRFDGGDPGADCVANGVLGIIAEVEPPVMAGGSKPGG